MPAFLRRAIFRPLVFEIYGLLAGGLRQVLLKSKFFNIYIVSKK